MSLIRYYSEQITSNCRKILHHHLQWGDFFLVGLGVASTIPRARACKRARLHAHVKLCSLDSLAYQKNKIAPLQVVV